MNKKALKTYEKIMERARDLERFILDHSMNEKNYNSSFQEKACILVGMLVSFEDVNNLASQPEKDAGNDEEAS